jgi:hypothetical protein
MERAPVLYPAAALRELTKNARELCGMLVRTGRAPECFTLSGLAEAEIVVMDLDRNGGWRHPVNDPPFALEEAKPNFSVQVLGVIADDDLFPGAEPFIDIVAYWPTDKRWTVTHASRADREAADHPVHVVAWRHMDELPPAWSALWA